MEGRPVEVDRHIAQLAAETRGATMEPAFRRMMPAPTPVLDGDEHERARAAASAPEPLAQRERVHVVVHDRGRAGGLGEEPRDGARP